MKYLTRKEELLLLAIVRLQDKASLVSIRELLDQTTGEDWTIGNIYVALDKLHNSGFLDSTTGEPTAKRGGKAIKYYKLTKDGSKILKQSKKVYDFMWKAFSSNVSEK